MANQIFKNAWKSSYLGLFVVVDPDELDGMLVVDGVVVDVFEQQQHVVGHGVPLLHANNDGMGFNSFSVIIYLSSIDYSELRRAKKCGFFESWTCTLYRSIPASWPIDHGRGMLPVLRLIDARLAGWSAGGGKYNAESPKKDSKEFEFK